MNANVSKLLNEQINKEFYSAYLYLDFANYYASVGLDGFENWYRVQAQGGTRDAQGCSTGGWRFIGYSIVYLEWETFYF